MSRGHFIAIEGNDGSGKSTHTNLLAAHLRKTDPAVTTQHFPRYGQPSAYFVEQYLAGKFGSLDEIGPYEASLFYAMDRYAAASEIKSLLASGATLICDRFIGSNLAHQGAKIESAHDRTAYYEWAQNLEFNIQGIPEPDLNIVLIMPARLGQKFVDSKTPLAYLSGRQRDIHENDVEYMSLVQQRFIELCELYPSNYVRIDCMKDGQLLTIDEVQAQIRKTVAARIKTQSDTLTTT